VSNLPPLSADLQRDAVSCECGCGNVEKMSRTTVVQAKYHQHSGKEHRIAGGKRWRVRKACEAGFLRELELLNAFKTMVEILADKPMWRRWRYAWSVYTAQVAINERTKGKRAARRTGYRSAIMLCTPTWFSDWLAARWRAANIPKV
jgi:hypothetical protein